MSVRTMARVWAGSRHGGTELLMLLAIADFADDEGNAYPAVQTLADKCRMGSRNANYILTALRESGELEVRLNEGPRGANRYRIVLESLGVQPISGVQAVAGVQCSSSTPAMGCTDPCNTVPHPLQPIADKPSLTTKETPGTTKKMRASKSRPMPEGFGVSDAVRAWAEREGFGLLEKHLEHFVGYAAAHGKTYVNWDQALMNAIRGNWAKLPAVPSKASGAPANWWQLAGFDGMHHANNHRCYEWNHQEFRDGQRISDARSAGRQRASLHSGFDQRDYREGIGPNGEIL